MISSFRLPDLVLGVSVRADTSGAKQAARDLKRAVQQEFGGAGGGGGGGGGGGFLGATSGAAIGATFGRQIIGGIGKAFRRSPVTASGQKLLTARRIAGLLPPATEKQQWAGTLRWPSVPGGTLLPKGETAVRGGGTLLNLLSGAGLGKAFSGLGGTVKKVAGLAGLGRIAGLVGSLGKAGIIGAIIAAIALAIYISVKVYVKALKAALTYIRNSGVGTEGKFGNFGRFAETLDEFSAAWANVWAQIGLAIIQIFELERILPPLTNMLIMFASALSWLSDQKWFKFMMQRAAGPLADPNLWKAMGWLMDKMPKGEGGKDLGRRMSANMAPAALEGSVAAYSMIRGTMIRYAAETARNTKVAADALQKIMQRAPELGVVAG